MALAITLAYDGADTLTANLTGGNPGDQYTLWADAGTGGTTGTIAADGTATITHSIAGSGVAAGYRFGVFVNTGSSFGAIDQPNVAVAVFAYGTTAPYLFGVTWSLPSASQVRASFTASGTTTNYGLYITDNHVGGSTPFTMPASGGTMTMTVTNDGSGSATSIVDGSYATLYDVDSGEDLAVTLIPIVPNNGIDSGGGGGGGGTTVFGTFSKIQFGNGLTVTQIDTETIRVDVS
jgi:hypothetical protein